MRAAMGERMISIMALVLLISIGFLVPNAAAQSDKYSKMAPVDQYLMERNAEILLARSAAPDSISSDATILVLGRRVGYKSIAITRAKLQSVATSGYLSADGLLNAVGVGEQSAQPIRRPSDFTNTEHSRPGARRMVCIPS